LVRDLVRAGEVQAEQTQALVNELVERNRRNTERFVEQIRAEVRRQMDAAESTRKDVVARMQSQINELRRQMPGAKRPTKKAAAKKTAVKKKAGAKKAAAKKKTAGKKRAAKKSVAAENVTTRIPDVP
jgi:polyhydroxyalkanoate synthesis regulator phasin